MNQPDILQRLDEENCKISHNAIYFCIIYKIQDEWLNAITPFMAIGNRRLEIRNRNGLTNLQA
jgi:hypothetical protein